MPLFGGQRDLAERREDLGHIARFDFNHDNVSWTSGVPAFLNGELLGSPVQHFSNGLYFALSDVARQIRNHCDRTPRSDFAAFADLEAVKRLHGMDLGAEATSARGIEAVPLELQLHLRSQALH